MSDVLLLTHRIPWPPDKGDKIRSYHFFCHLAERYRLHLGTFVDSPADWRHVPELEKRCASVCIRPTGRWRSVTRGIRALLQGRPVTMAYYDDDDMSRWIAGLSRDNRLAAAFVYSAGMAGFVDPLPTSVARVLDMVDVDSEKWREYADRKSWPQSWIYKREARLLGRVEAALVPQFERTLLVSEQEAGLLRGRCPGFEGRIESVPNGVDSDYFSPGDHACPFSAGSRPIVFTGAMDYWANIEGVCWFARGILPRIRQLVPEAQFYVVGSNPSADVQALGQLPGVVVTGRVPDVRPYLAHASVVVAPLRIARGLQNKVLEAMAMARPVVATTAAMRGIDCQNAGIRIVDTADRCAAAVMELLDGTQFLENRRFVTEHFSWAAAIGKLEQAMQTEEYRAEANCA